MQVSRAFKKNSAPRIIIIKPSALGDIVHSLPVLSALRRRFPNAQVHWAVAKGFERILENHPMIDRIWTLDKDSWKRFSRFGETVREFRSLGREWRRERFDIAIDLQGLFRSAALSLLTGAGTRIGFMEGREGSPLAYTHRVRGGRDVHAVDRYLRTTSALGCEFLPAEFIFPPLPAVLPFEDLIPPRFAIIAPSAGKEANRWPAEKFGQLASMLEIPSLIVAGAADSSVANEVERESGGKAVSLAGKTDLPKLASLISRASLFISNDTGPMHIAAAFGIRVIAIFGPANPVRTGPYGPGHTIVRRDLPCSPCYARRRCPDWECINRISVQQVFEAISHPNQDSPPD